MKTNSYEPQALVAATETIDDLDPDFGDTTDRHDGWTGQRMAMFCALLAETGIVTDACHAVGKSTTSAYSARRRNPLFGAAWEESLSLARNRLADALLERSLNGSVEKYYRDGELAGEKRILDNRLGMQVLRRLDARAEKLGIAASSARSATARTTPEHSPDWDLMLAALRTGDEAMIAEALAEASRAGLPGAVEHESSKLEAHKVGEVGEVCVAGNPSGAAVNFDEEDEPARCWWDEEEECWMTDFPPPADFDRHQKGRWGDEDYVRECTREEAEKLQSALDAELSEERSEDEALRDAWFAQLPDRISADRNVTGEGLP